MPESRGLARHLPAPEAANEAFPEKMRSKNSVHAAYGATILNARMVNGDSLCQNLPVFCKKMPRKNDFLAFKNTVNYKRRFDLNCNCDCLGVIK
jgi:hypothetical protein